MAGAADFQRSKTQCPQGHPYDEKNTKRTKDGRACKACHREKEKKRRATPAGKADAAIRMRKWRQSHREFDLQRHKNRRIKAQQWIDSQRLACIRCGEDHPAVLDFHHRNPKEKEFSISWAILTERAKWRVIKEIEKCDVLCANCHRKHHWEERMEKRSADNRVDIQEAA